MAVKKEMKFEDAFARLEESVRSLESAELTLDESISTFEEAMRLVGICNQRLEKAEERVRILTEGVDGTVTDMPFGALQNED